MFRELKIFKALKITKKTKKARPTVQSYQVPCVPALIHLQFGQNKAEKKLVNRLYLNNKTVIIEKYKKMI